MQIYPTSEQTRKCYIICFLLTFRFQKTVELVCIDDRSKHLIILSGEETNISINPNGEVRTYE